MSEEAPFVVLSGTNSRYLAEKVCAGLNCPLGNMNITHFTDGGFAVSYEESIRGTHVFLIQSTFPNSDNLMGLLLMIDAVKRISAKSVIAVVPYFGWARQDRRDKPRVSIGAKLVTGLLSVAGIDHLITMDLYADQIQGFFNIPMDHLYAPAVFLPYVQSLKLGELVTTTPDVGGSERAGTFSKYLGMPLVLCNKSHEKASEVTSMQIIGGVKGKNVILIDDIVDTTGAITEAANIMPETGTNSVRTIASRCVISNLVSFRIQESGLTEMVFTDSIPCSKKYVRVKQLSIVGMFAETIRRVINSESIGSRYII